MPTLGLNIYTDILTGFAVFIMIVCTIILIHENEEK